MKEIFDSMIVLDASLGVWKIVLRLFFAILAGFFIGLENRYRSKEAGLKTHTLLCFTACILMIVSKYSCFELAKLEGISYDASRIASNIVNGLCFLGAGIVLYKKDSVKGLTSAVSICLTIAIGMCFGGGLIITGAIATVITILLQLFLHSNKWFFKAQKLIICKAKFILDEKYIEHFKQVFDIKHFNQFRLVRENEQEIAEVEFMYRVKKTSEELLEIVKSEKQIIMFEKIEEK